MLCWGCYQGCSTEFPPSFLLGEVGQRRARVDLCFLLKISARVPLGGEVSSVAEGSDFFIGCVSFFFIRRNMVPGLSLSRYVGLYYHASASTYPPDFNGVILKFKKPTKEI